jgi:hypothetical protein
MNATQLAATLDLLHLHAESAAEAIDEYAETLYSSPRGDWRWRAELMRARAREFERLIELLRGKERTKAE